tara:strand:- start:351 stop:500 length:150 start_codon:yes stop_codon:yes gene_type:complete
LVTAAEQEQDIQMVLKAPVHLHKFQLMQITDLEAALVAVAAALKANGAE